MVFPTAVTIRTARSADIEAIRALELRSATAAHWTADTYDRILSSSGPKRLSLVLEEGGAVVAFAVVRGGDSEWELENIVVALEARRRGLGSRLMQALLLEARKAGADGILLEVRESNQAARALYRTWSFVEVGRRRDYYSDPSEDAIVCRLRFDEENRRANL